jgi:molecular chaperone GrpE
MNDKRSASREPQQPGAPDVPAEPVEAGAVTGEHPGGAVLEPAPAAVERLEAQHAELTDRHLRLAAEYENFRRRTAKERGEVWARAQADLLGRLIDALDDLARFAQVDPAQTGAKALHEGVNLVERKVWKELEGAGVQRIDAIGVAFDPHVHEAVVTAPAREAAQDQTVGAVLQAGYKLGDLLIRPARVQVLTWQGGG